MLEQWAVKVWYWLFKKLLLGSFSTSLQVELSCQVTVISCVCVNLIFLNWQELFICSIYMIPALVLWGTRWHSWLRHCTTSRKVAGSILDGVIGIFHWHNSSGRTMALESTQPLTEMSTRNISWGRGRGKGGRCVGLPTLPPSFADCLEIWEPPTSWNPQGLSRPVMGLLYLYLYAL